MLGVLLAFGLVGGIVGLGIKETVEPRISRAWAKRKLSKLAGKLALTPARLTLDEAEDGLVLARRLGEATLAKRFEAAVAERKRKRPRV